MLKINNNCFLFIIIIINVFFLFNKAQCEENYVVSLTGNGRIVHQNKDLEIGNKPIPFKWQETVFFSNNLCSLKISDSISGIWYLLPNSNLIISNKIESHKIREANLNFGEIRIKAAGNIHDLSLKELENFKYKNNIILNTEQLKISIPLATDVIISKITDSFRKKITKVIVLSGKVDISILNQKDKNSIELGNKQKFIIDENNIISPITNAEDREYSHILAFTSSAGENVSSGKEKIDTFKLKKVLDYADKLANEKEYIKLQYVLNPYEKYFKEDVRIPYYLGVAKYGLKQTSLAITYFNKALKVDKNFYAAHWQLAFLYLEMEKYEKAKNEFKLARDLMDDDNPLTHEYNYYTGVINFRLKELFDAKDNFMIAVDDEKLNQELRNSANEFLTQIRVTKAWSISISNSMDYSNNVLSLAQNQSIPEPYKTNSQWRYVNSLSYDYDSSKKSEDTGMFIGFGSSVSTVKNTEAAFGIMDSNVFEAKVYETFRYLNSETKNMESYSISQSYGRVYANKIRNSDYFVLALNYTPLNIGLSVSVNIDASRPPTDLNRTSVSTSQSFMAPLPSISIFYCSLPISFSESWVLQTSPYNRHSLSTSVSPSCGASLNQDASLSMGNSFSLSQSYLTPTMINVSLSPNVSLSYILTKWLSSSISSSLNWSYTPESDLVVVVPSLSGSLSAMF